MIIIIIDLVIQLILAILVLHYIYQKNKLITDLLDACTAAEENALYYARCYYKVLNQLHQKEVRSKIK